MGMMNQENSGSSDDGGELQMLLSFLISEQGRDWIVDYFEVR